MFEELKNYLGIEFNDSDNTLLLQLEASKKYFKRICGVELDFENNEDYKELLFERCRYANANALELFESNYKTTLNSLRFEVAVSEYARQKKTK